MLKNVSLLQIPLQTHLIFKYYKDVTDVTEYLVLLDQLVGKKEPKVNKD